MTEPQVAILLADLALIVVVARLFGWAARALGQPAVLGEIVAGVLLGPSLFGGVVADTVFPEQIRPHLGALANLGLVLFMFLVGLEFDFDRLRGLGRVAGAAVVGGTVVPFGLGVLLALYLARANPPADPVAFTLFVGVAVSVTAFPVLARILTDRGMNRSRLGTIALSAAAVCDLAAWSMLALIQAATAGDHSGWTVALVVPYAGLLVAARPLLRRRLTVPGPAVLAVASVGALGSAAVTQFLGLHAVFGAFLFGLALPRLTEPGPRADVVRATTAMMSLLLPVYFIVTGFQVDLSAVDATGWADLALIMVVAVSGKFGGTWLAVRGQGLPARPAAVVATLMNTRGLTELIALNVGLRAGILPADLYSSLVVMAVVTTAMAGPLLRHLLRPEDLSPS